MSKKRLVEPFIVTVDDLYGSFGMVFWFQKEEVAKECYDTLAQEFPDREGRHKRLWKLMVSSDTTQLTSDSRKKEGK